MTSQLSPRQREILDLVAEGRTSKEIAVALGISESTVNWHLANAFERLGASSRAEAVARAMRSNGADPVASPADRGGSATRISWRRLALIALAIALAGALLGGVTVATFHLGAPPPAQSAAPANSSLGPTASATVSPSREGIFGDGVGSDPSRVPATPMVGPITAPVLPSVAVPLPSPTIPSLPLPSIPLPTLPLPTTPPSPLP